MRLAFTLVELLVVVTIMVILLALLTPSLDRAIYQAEMALCQANKHGLGVGVMNYASENKRHYTYRAGMSPNNMQPGCLSMGRPEWDDRPLLRPYISLNGTLSCPLLPKMDIDGSDADTQIYTYNMWFGFRFLGTVNNESMPSLRRIGDRWEYQDVERQYRLKSNLLAGTRYVYLENGDFVSSIHPGDTYTELWGQDRYFYNPALGGDIGAGVDGLTRIKATLGQWNSRDRSRGKVDLNELFDDLSVIRYTAVDWLEDERMARAPYDSHTGATTTTWEIVPKR